MCDEPLADAIVVTRLGSSFDHDEYWSQVIRFLIDNPDFGIGNVASIIEYLNFNRHLLKQQAPGLLKRKKADQFLRDVKLWRAASPMPRRSSLLKWKATSINGFEYLDERRVWNPSQWTIRELLDGSDLLDEGRVGAVHVNLGAEGIDAYCPQCRRVYCGDHYLLATEYDEGFYDCTRATCPAGHRRMVDD